MTAPFGRARKAPYSLGKEPSGTFETYRPARKRPRHAARLARGRGARAVERGGLENRRAWQQVPWVRIPPPPLSSRLLANLMHPAGGAVFSTACPQSTQVHGPLATS